MNSEVKIRPFRDDVTKLLKYTFIIKTKERLSLL